MKDFATISKSAAWFTACVNSLNDDDVASMRHYREKILKEDDPLYSAFTGRTFMREDDEKNARSFFELTLKNLHRKPVTDAHYIKLYCQAYIAAMDGQLQECARLIAMAVAWRPSKTTFICLPLFRLEDLEGWHGGD